jgi:ubiquinone/menaquinone biosynthesis C-methylase UbiE
MLKRSVNEAVGIIYEEQKVPAVFQPLAVATLARLSLSADDTVLDVACGTGIVARTLALQNPGIANIVGADLNKGMIEHARTLTASEAGRFEWHVADAANMPFADSCFTLVLCQQGLQFFPDPNAALQEMRRVMRVSGQLALTVWSEPSPLFVSLADALRRHATEELAKKSLAPFGFPGHATLVPMMEAAGFEVETNDNISVNRSLGEPHTAIPKEILGNPIGPAVEALGEATMDAIVRDTIAGLDAYRVGPGLVVPQVARLIIARAGA